MKAVNKKSFLLVIALALVFSLTVGLTLAYFSDYNAAKGESTIALGGKTEIDETYDEDQKTVKIYNKGDVPVVVRVAVYAPIVGEQTATVTSKTPGDWVEGDSEEATDTTYWYYTQVIEPKQYSSELIVSTTYLKNADLGNTVNVVVTHESSQVAYKEDGTVIVPKGWENKIK